MSRRTGIALFCCLLTAIALSTPVFGRELVPAGERSDAGRRLGLAAPAFCIAAHRVNKLTIAMANNGTFGNGFYPEAPIDFFTGQPVPSCEFPAGSDTRYLFGGALWVGAVVNGDTLVSTGADGWVHIREFFPDEAPAGNMIRRSTLDPNSPEYPGAISQEDLIATCADTFVALADSDPWTGQPHRPLYLEVTRSSYAWSYPYAENFVIMHYQIKNIGTEPLHDAVVGLYVDADVYATTVPEGFTDDVSGFVQSAEVQYGQCSFSEPQNLAWIADNDGDLSLPSNERVPNVTGTVPLAFPTLEFGANYNWWVSNGYAELDFGPRRRGTVSDPFRDFGTGGTGTPMGDANKYYILRHREVDYDQVFTATIGPSDSVWLAPPANIATDVADGYDTRYLLSLGPIDIGPGQSLPATFAYVAGRNFHVDPNNASQNLPNNPQAYEDNLNFGDLLNNARWARWIYDNPGVDTDSDGYAGEFHVCDGDTIYYTGDYFPDYRAASAPPAPPTWVSPIIGGLHVRWNGLVSEETPDVFTHVKDFEGYRVYFTPMGSGGGYALIDSWDRQDWYKYVWDDLHSRWQPDRRLAPYTRQELQCIYGTPPNPCWDSTFDPDAYPETHPLVHLDTIMYFEPVDLNHSEFGVQTKIMKTYPDQPYPSSLNPSQADPSELTPDGYFKYFEYQLDIPNLLPREEYCVKVTAFDFGAQATGIPPLESKADPHCASPATGGPTPTYEWINVYCDEPLLNWNPLRPGAVIEAFDPDGVLCGRDSVRADGAYGFMPIYRDDPYSEIDEGAEPGDTITFRVNGQEVRTGTPVVWTSNGASFEVCRFFACQTMHLKAGWNLVSWNRQLFFDIDELMVLLADCDVDVILGFNHGALTYDPQLPEFSTLDFLDYFHGYWIKVGSDCDVDLCGPPIPLDQTIPISTGWNLVSYWPEQQLPIEVAFMSMYHDLQVALGFDGAGLVHLPGDPVHSTLTALDPGHGYWVKSFVDNALAYPGYGGPLPTASIASKPAASGITASRDWMSIYGAGLTLDGRPLAEGTVIEAYSSTGTICGSGTYADGVLKFTPVYGRDAQVDESKTYPTAGDNVQLRIDGQPVSPALTFEGNGARVQINTLTSGTDLPTSFKLGQNYPNPFNPTTEISFDLPATAQVRLEVFNVMGQRVSVLVDERLEAGSHTVTFDGDRLASGIYLYRIQAGSFTESRKMLLLK